MTTPLTPEDIYEKLLGPDRDGHLVVIFKQWKWLTDDQRHEIIKLMTGYVLQNQAEELGRKKGDKYV